MQGSPELKQHSLKTNNNQKPCSKAYDDLDVPKENVIVVVDVNDVEEAVDEVHGWKGMSMLIQKA